GRHAGRFRHQLALDGERRAAAWARAAMRAGAARGRLVVIIGRLDVIQGIVAASILAIARRAILGEAAAALVGLRALPARRGVARTAEGRHAVEARGAIARRAAERAFALGHLDMLWRQFVEEA